MLSPTDMLWTLGQTSGVALVAFGLGMWFAKDPQAKQVLTDNADYIEWVLEQGVHAAEFASRNTPMVGADKFAHALRFVNKSLDAAGILGDAAKLTPERLAKDIERVKAKLYPGSASKQAG